MASRMDESGSKTFGWNGGAVKDADGLKAYLPPGVTVAAGGEPGATVELRVRTDDGLTSLLHLILEANQEWIGAAPEAKDVMDLTLVPGPALDQDHSVIHSFCVGP